MEHPERHSVILVDDCVAIMKCVGRCLEEDAKLRVLGLAHHAQAGVAMALDLKPDVVLMDIHMPGADAFWACREIVRLSGNKIRVVFYTGFANDQYLDRCIESGGVGMVSKITEPLQNVGLAVRHALRGERYFSPELARRLLEHDGDKPRSRWSTMHPRELDVLRRLAIGKTNREIAEEMSIGLRSVEKAVSDLKKKLGIASTNELLIFAANEGLVFPELQVVTASGKSPDDEPADEESAGEGEDDAGHDVGSSDSDA